MITFKLFGKDMPYNIISKKLSANLSKKNIIGILHVYTGLSTDKYMVKFYDNTYTRIYNNFGIHNSINVIFSNK